MRDGAASEEAGTLAHHFDEKLDNLSVEKHQDLKIACLGGGYHNGWISVECLREIARPMMKNQYGQFLLQVIDEKNKDMVP